MSSWPGGLLPLSRTGYLATELKRVPCTSEIAVDGPVAFFVLALATLTGILIAVVPVLHTLSSAQSRVLRAEGRTGTGGCGVRRMHNGLVVRRVDFGLVLLVGAAKLAMESDAPVPEPQISLFDLCLFAPVKATPCGFPRAIGCPVTRGTH